MEIEEGPPNLMFLTFGSLSTRAPGRRAAAVFICRLLVNLRPASQEAVIGKNFMNTITIRDRRRFQTINR